MQELTKELDSRFEELGYQFRVVSAHHLHDLQEAIEGDLGRGLLSETLYREWLTDFSFRLPDILPQAKSLVVVAVPQPQIIVKFTWQGKPRPIMIPPTYVSSEQTNKRVGDTLSSVLGPRGYRVAKAALPLKLLAVRSGLGDYGRNNICYVAGMGSFHRLVAFYSEFRPPEDVWRDPKMMGFCQGCQACLQACPTGAISSERFLINAERCITFHNERPGKFPTWVEDSWHNCLTGCLYCQKICPQNISFLDWVEGGYLFTEEETSLILASTLPNRLPAETVKKLDRLGLLDYIGVLPRNLSILLRRD